MDPNVSLKLSKRADETLWGKAISSIGRVVYSSTFNIYVLLIATKRNSILRAFNNYMHINDHKEESKRDAISEKYKKAYNSYINTLDKYITENIYSKMQKRAATIDEEHIMAKYYEVCKYKNDDQTLFKTKLETLVLNMDWNNVQAAKSENFISKYKNFYLFNIEELYKSEMRHDAILLANCKEGDRDQYEAIYSLIESYIKEVLPILPENDETNKIIKDYRKYVSAIDAYEKKDFLELRKRLTLLSFTRELFEFSLPMVAKEQCYLEIIEIARVILTNYYSEAEKFASFEVILDAIEEYVENILAYKPYWEKEEDKKAYDKFNEKFSILKKLARIDYDGYKKQREILFINYDLEAMNKQKIKLPELRDYYRERLIMHHALRELKKKAKVIGGIWRSRRRMRPDAISAKEKIQAFSIENIINSISQIAHEQYDEFQKRQMRMKALNNIENSAPNDEEDNVQENNAKPVLNVVNFILRGGKKFKKRKAL